MITIYVTFGQRHRHEAHPADDRATPDGWFEFIGHDRELVMKAVQQHLTPPGERYGHYARASETQPAALPHPLGCIAKFAVTDMGVIHEVKP